MKRSLQLAVLLVLLPGCWVRLPVVPGDGVEGRGGEVRTLEEDIKLVRYLGRHYARKLPDKADAEGEIVRKGSRIRVGKAVKRIEEPGVEYFYVCVVEETGRKFDLPFSYRETIGLPLWSKWMDHGGAE
ncbi:MAG: hypothetical protein KF712_20010 [Akkermansiaceae bacterium]|nr:hypothetical protein [Akkermansiaceae bacterium]